jgi:Fuc2NAc and GlcNAc transferase
MIYFFLFIVSLGLTYSIRWYALKKSILDIPNGRSSHSIPTPRGGGLAIIISFFLGLFFFHEQIENRLFYALLCVLPIVIVSLIDDIISTSSLLRALVQSLSILGALICLGGVNSIDFILFSLEGSWLNIVAFISMFWLTNLYNFLDGIDGYAGSQAITAGFGLFLFFANPLGLVLVVSSLGFLFFNWHKASIFMGDVGSVSLGFIFSIFMFYNPSEGNIFIWLILLSLFWFDATITLVRRFLNKENLTEAHNKHAYQRLVQSGYSHAKVVRLSLLFNLLFLVLLYSFHGLLRIFFLAIVSLTLIMFFIEKKKHFSLK